MQFDVSNPTNFLLIVEKHIGTLLIHIPILIIIEQTRNVENIFHQYFFTYKMY